LCISSRLNDRYANGKVRKALAIASQPAIFIPFEVKSSPFIKLDSGLTLICRNQQSLIQFQPDKLKTVKHPDFIKQVIRRLPLRVSGGTGTLNKCSLQ
jgi:hypothetical protein